MKKNFIKLFSFLILTVYTISLYSQTNYKLPKALFLTTGADEGRGTISDGIVLALQTFNKLGVQLELNNRSVLLENELSKYDILILPTIKGYHDLPLKESLTFLSEKEMNLISKWVYNGGTLVAGENIGRNTIKGKDRISIYKKLNNNNWQLANCLGVELVEKNIAGFEILDPNFGNWKYTIFKSYKESDWRLVPKITTAKTLGIWKKGNEQFPSFTLNTYGKGNAFLIPFWLLHPTSDGGLSTEKEIDDFYKYVFNTAIGKRKNNIYLSPWKDGHTSAYCQTFDDGGNKDEYKRIISFINKNKLPTVFFVTPNIEENILPLLKQEAFISLQGHSFNHPDFRKLDFFHTKREFLTNRNFWSKKFKGFRFPYVSNSFWGLYILNELGFDYETSIAANHFDFIRGSVVPYNIPIFKDDFFKSLDLLEISQIYNSDWHFYKKTLENEEYTEIEQKNDAKEFEAYLFNYFNTIIKPNNGVMVYLGHPMYTGISDITLAPVEKLLKHLKKENVWITSLNNVAKRYNQFKSLSVVISENKNSLDLNIDTKGEKIEGLTFRLDQKPKKVVFNKKYSITEMDGVYFLIFDALDKETITLSF